jgi:hypothetical protein
MFAASKIIKRATLAGLFGVGLAAAFSAPASAHSYTRCDYDGDRCVRVNCDWDGDRCWRESTYYRDSDDYSYYRGRGRWVCDYDGDDCHWVYYGHRPYYYGPRVGLGIGLRF